MLCKQNTKSQASLQSVNLQRDIFVAWFTLPDQIIAGANASESEVESVSVVRYVEIADRTILGFVWPVKERPRFCG